MKTLLVLMLAFGKQAACSELLSAFYGFASPADALAICQKHFGAESVWTARAQYEVRLEQLRLHQPDKAKLFAYSPGYGTEPHWKFFAL